MDLRGLAPSAGALAAAVFLDAAIGDPEYSLHPIRIMGRTLSAGERVLRRIGLDGYLGGCLLLALLAVVWVAIPSILIQRLYPYHLKTYFIVTSLLVYTLLALRDLIDHVGAVGRAATARNLDGARNAIGRMVGRDIDKMDLDACRRAAIESLAENFVDGFLAAVFWYVLLGLPGLLLFKVASTMDSMVGYKTPKYRQFGWCGARLDDVMNYIPARIAWVVLGIAAIFVRGASAAKAWRIGWAQHGIVPGPNPGWSEATMAGVLQRRLIGPIFKNGQLVTSIWLGDPADPAGGTHEDLTRSIAVTIVSAALVAVVAIAVLVLAV